MQGFVKHLIGFSNEFDNSILYRIHILWYDAKITFHEHFLHHKNSVDVCIAPALGEITIYIMNW